MRIKELETKEIIFVSGGVGVRDAATVVFQFGALLLTSYAVTNVFFKPVTGLGTRTLISSIFNGSKSKHALILAASHYLLPFVGALAFGVVGLGFDAIFNRGQTVEIEKHD